VSRKVRVAVVALVLGLASVSTAARADEPTLAEVEHDPSVKPPPASQSRLFLTGLIVTAGWYGGAVGTSYLWHNAPNASDLRIPVVGPYMAFGDVGCGNRERNCTTFFVVLRTGLTALSAVGQTGGVLAMVESLFLPTSSEADTARLRATTRDVSSLHAYPLVTEDGSLGLGLSGSF